MTKEETERVYGEGKDRWEQAHSQLVPLEQLDTGIGLARRQIRTLAENQIHNALRGFQQVHPTNHQAHRRDTVERKIWRIQVCNP